MVFSSSNFLGGVEEFGGPHGLHALLAGRNHPGPARAEEAGFRYAGDGGGVGLIAAEDVEVRVVLAEGKTDMAA